MAEPRAEPVLQVEDLHKSFVVYRRSGLWRRRTAIRALRGVGLQLRAGECLGIVGESGCGKSTLARCLTGLIAADAGRVACDGIDLARLRGEALRRARRRIQLVFQDPAAALDPRMTVARAVGDAVRLARPSSGSDEVRRRLVELLRSVELEPEHGERLPHQLSGGQKQRVVLARALAAQPRVLVLDEPVSALDASIRGRILELLVRLRQELALSYVFIGHDLEVVERFADRVQVLYAGRTVEAAAAAEVFGRPRHPYSAALAAARPSPVPRRMASSRGVEAVPRLGGEPPSPEAPPTGCAFHPRCPRATPDCAAAEPAWQSLADADLDGDPGDGFACFHPLVSGASPDHV